MKTAPPSDTLHQDELTRLEILRAYKKLFGGDGTANRSPFSEHRIVRYDTDIEPWDVPDIYKEARDSIKQALSELHRNQLPNVVVLAGGPGMGKSHLINYFRNPVIQEELGYILVGNSNHWKVEEFESCLLTSMVGEMLRPNPNGPNLLLSKIESIAFEALDQILKQPGKINDFRGKKRGLSSRFKWLTRLLRGDATTYFQNVVNQRNTRALRELDFLKFADFICDRFLHFRTNPFHRFVFHVLLRFLFPEDRRFVAAWLVGMKIDATFFKRIGYDGKEPTDPDWPSAEQVAAHLEGTIGMSDHLDCNYKIIDTVKILVSLFGTSIGHRDGSVNDPENRVFFFAFDQIEGRHELFESEKDWFKFFAKLSELYNSLPNVYILFTMTLLLRNDLYPRMERQFQQRIHRDQKFVLEGLEDGDILAIYRKHLESWRNGQMSQLVEYFDRPQFQFVPFTQEQVLEQGRRKSIREMLEIFDREFRTFLIEKVRLKEARQEFLIKLNELREIEGKPNSHKYISSHLDVLHKLLERSADSITDDPELLISLYEKAKTEEGDDAYAILFKCPSVSELSIRVYVAVVPFAYAVAERFVKLLAGKGKGKARNFLWLIRADTMKSEYQNRKPGQVFTRAIMSGTHSRLLALLHLIGKREQFEESGELTWDDQNKFSSETMEMVSKEVKNTYLGELFLQVRASFDQLGEANSDADE
ncbi:MAG: hypothetical protein K8T89_23255 [Planctomycetes bacterium]|nr:hypothetical protein [Planctomycetota bacterium]